MDDDGNGNLLRLFGRWNSGKHRHRLFGPGDHDWGDGFLDGHRVTNGGGGRIRERTTTAPPPGTPAAEPVISPAEYAINALDMARDVIANWRMYHGDESTYGKCQWIDGWYWSFTYQGNENITTYYNATAAADASHMFTTWINDPAIRAGDSINWWYDIDGHIGTAIGWDGDRLLVGHTSNNCDTVLDLGNNYKVSHADTVGLAFRGASHTNGNNIERAGLVPYIIGQAPTPPTPIPIPEEWNIPMGTTVIYTNDTPDDKRRGAIIDTTSGFVAEFSWFAPPYADDIARGFHGSKDVGAAPVTSGSFTAITDALGKLKV
jgi:hypothetical protein